MSKIVVVRLREAGVASQFSFEDAIDVIPGDYVVVESERGNDYGQIISEPQDTSEGASKRLKKIARIMTVDDMHKVKENKKQAEDDKKACDKKIREYKLDMKLINAEYSFDRSKIIFYFTAEGRVDFRNLVKDLAKEFKTRIEMRQVGVRDEAKLFGGVGPCGQSLCCSSFLRNFEPVTIKMAKEQNLPLNPSKISGICGRLMCCLGYEHKCYKALKKDLPREGQSIHTEKGKAKVLKVYILKGELLLQYEEGPIERRLFKELQEEKNCGCGGSCDKKNAQAKPEAVTPKDVKPKENAKKFESRPDRPRPPRPKKKPWKDRDRNKNREASQNQNKEQPKPQEKRPEVKRPEVKKPEVKKPEVKKPDVKKSKFGGSFFSRKKKIS